MFYVFVYVCVCCIACFMVIGLFDVNNKLKVFVRNYYSSSTKAKPYSPPGQQQPRKSRNIKTVSGSYNVSDSDDDDDDNEGVKIEEIN